MLASLVLPAVCEKCGVWKRTPDGNAVYVTIAWKAGKTLICTKCQETLKLMDDLGDMVATDLDDDIPF